MGFRSIAGARQVDKGGELKDTIRAQISGFSPETAREEAIHAAHFGLRQHHMAGKCPKLTGFVDPLIRNSAFTGPDWNPLEFRCRAEKTLDLYFAFLAFERACAVDEKPAGFDETGRSNEQRVLVD